MAKKRLSDHVTMIPALGTRQSRKSGVPSGSEPTIWLNKSALAFQPTCIQKNQNGSIPQPRRANKSPGEEQMRAHGLVRMQLPFQGRSCNLLPAWPHGAQRELTCIAHAKPGRRGSHASTTACCHGPVDTLFSCPKLNLCYAMACVLFSLF